MRPTGNVTPEGTYDVLRNNAEWPDHLVRDQVTLGIIKSLGLGASFSAVDPACGDGFLIRSLEDEDRLAPDSWWNDISQKNYDAMLEKTGWTDEDYGPQDIVDCLNTIEGRQGGVPADLVILTEILEHVEDPVKVLQAASSVATNIVASSPLTQKDQTDPNPEHLWMFDEAEYVALLRDGGWMPRHHVILRFDEPHYPYIFQIWTGVRSG